MHFLQAFDFNKQTSLYVHVPFCKSKCSYCAFYSKPCNTELIDLYFNRLIDEVSSVVDKMKKPFYTAYIGGGNPGCLSVDQMEILCRKICTFGRPQEFTVEMNPESLTEKHYSLFDIYLTRISMGVQSLDSNALDFLGRNASRSSTIDGIKRVIELNKQTGCQVSFDLITCLPSWHDYLKDVAEIVEGYEPDHISVYALTLEKGTPLAELNPLLPNSDEQYCILNDVWSYLSAHGYNQYEVSNFSKNGKYSKHNSVYWDYQQYIGLGPAASSTGFVKDSVFRVESPYDLNSFCNGRPFDGYSLTELSSEEAVEEFVLMGLRHSKGLDLVRLQKDFGLTFKGNVEGFSVDNGFLKPDKNGLMIADWAASYVLDSCIDR